MRLHLSVLGLMCLCPSPYQAVNAAKSGVDEVKQQKEHETTESTPLLTALDIVLELFQQGQIQQKAGHLREDIEDEIDAQREKAAKAWAAEQMAAKKKIKKLTKASEQLKLIDRLAKPTRFAEMQFTMENPNVTKSSKNRSSTDGKNSAKSITKTTTSRPKQTQSSTTQSPGNATIPIAGFGLGDGFGRHTR